MHLVEGVTGELYGMKGIAPVVYYQPHSLRGASGADESTRLCLRTLLGVLRQTMPLQMKPKVFERREPVFAWYGLNS